jgi:hypothetical protein
MAVHEIGRWPCDKCGNICVAAGTRIGSFLKNGAFVGACPWACGAWIRRGFRSVPGAVRVYTSEQWHQFAVARQASRMAAA